LATASAIPKANARLLDWYQHNSQLFGGSAKEWGWLTGDMIGSDSIMLDIGANVGIYAHGLLRTFPQVHVISFEPIEQYAQFIRNHPLSNTQRLTVEALAMGHEPAPTNLTLLMDKSNLGWNTLHTSAAVIECAECMEATQITSVSFDYYYSLRPELSAHKFGFIKIDTEGYEFRVLQGMRGFLTQKALAGQLPLMLIEVAWGPLKHPHWAEEVTALEWLISLGYQRPDYSVASTQDVWFVPLRKWP
jgi:FkbM family methyltransferase